MRGTTDRITSAGGLSYSVDAAGETTTTYSYNGDGLRVSSTTGGVTTTVVDDVAQGLPVRLVDSRHLYVYGPEGLAYVTDSTGSTLQGVIHPDGLGSVRALTDSSGSVVQVQATDAWGMVTQSQGSVSQPVAYTGEVQDPTGLVNLRARMYDPSSGRFLQQDPLPKSGPGILGWNRYAYAGDNPANLVDPSGHSVAQNQVLSGDPQAAAPGASDSTGTSSDECTFHGLIHGGDPSELINNPACRSNLIQAGGAVLGMDVGDNPLLGAEPGGLDQTTAGEDSAGAVDSPGMPTVQRVLADLQPGRSRGVWTVESGDQLETAFGELTQGGTQISWTNYDGVV